MLIVLPKVKNYPFVVLSLAKSCLPKGMSFFYPKNHISSLFIIVLFSSTISLARIGEEKAKLEVRLFRSGGLIIKNDELVAQKQKGTPYMKFIDYLPESTEIKIYFKTFDGKRPKYPELKHKIPEGWILHVLYYKNVSMLEYYQKSEVIDEFEQSNLLDIQKLNSFWVQRKKEDKGKQNGCFDFDFMRDDQRVKVKLLGKSSILFVMNEFDEALSTAKDNTLQKSAPQSVKGF